WRRSFLTDRVAVTVEKNRAQPGEELTAPVVAAQTFPSLDQGVLRQVLRKGRVGAKRNCLPQQTRFINPAHLAECVNVPCKGAVQQIARSWDFDFHESWSQAEHVWSIAERAGQFHSELPGLPAELDRAIICAAPGPHSFR